MNPYILLIAAFGLWYIPSAIAFLKVDFEIKGFSLVKIATNYIDISVNLELINNSKLNAKIDRLDMNVYFNDTYISKIYLQNIPVPSKQRITAPAMLRIDKKNVGSAIWAIFLNNNFLDSYFTFRGNARSKGRVYPFETTLKITELG